MSQRLLIDLWWGHLSSFVILTLEGRKSKKISIKTNILDEGSHIDDMIESISTPFGLT